LGFFLLDEAMGFPVAQFSAHLAFFPLASALYHSRAVSPIQQLSKIENTGFSHLGQAYNARKGSTYTLAATSGCGLFVSGIGQIQGGVP
jgi:hypothetical protein